MADISIQLDTISTSVFGNSVCNAIAEAIEILQKERYRMVDISQELLTIRSGIYGKDIRQAIYDALSKLSNSEGSGGNEVYNVAVEEIERKIPLIKNKESSMYWVDEVKTR